MRVYFAELVATGIAFLCALTNHAGACFVWRKLFWKADLWASRVMEQAHHYPESRHTTAPVEAAWTPVCNCYQARTGFVNLNGATVSYRYCPTHGMVRDA